MTANRLTVLISLAVTSLAGLTIPASAAIVLGTAGDFAVLAGSTVTNTGSTVILGGSVGVSPGTAITGFPPGLVTPPYTIQPGNILTAQQAHTDLITAYNSAKFLGGAVDKTGQNLGGMILTAGTYSFSSSAALTGTLTLDAQGNPNAQFVFQIGTTLTTSSSSTVTTINLGGSTTPGHNVFWQVGSSATLGTSSAFQGHILADQSITLTTGATILNGSALAVNGAVTLDTNRINAIPEPTTLSLTLLGGALLLIRRTPRSHRGRQA